MKQKKHRIIARKFRPGMATGFPIARKIAGKKKEKSDRDDS